MLTKNYYIYIVCNISNTTFYVGVTNNLKRRIFEHKNQLVDGFSKRYHLNKLVYYETTQNVESALQREKSLKGITRNRKIQLIKSSNPTFKDLFNIVCM